MDQKRPWINQEVHKRVKKFAENHSLGISEAYEGIIDSRLDSEGRLRKSPPEAVISLNEDTYLEVKKAAERLNLSIEEMVDRMLWTVIIIFSGEISLSDIFREIWLKKMNE